MKKLLLILFLLFLPLFLIPLASADVIVSIDNPAYLPVQAQNGIRIGD